jgi:Lon protease-like protein
MAACKAFLAQIKEGSMPWYVRRFNDTFGSPPADASTFSFWFALLLPIDEYEKARLLPIRSVRLRLRLVVQWVEGLNSNWWFSNGCVIF